MKILLFVITLGGGGAEKVLVDVIKNLNKQKYNVTVISLFDEGKYNKVISEYANYQYFFKGFSKNLILRKIKNWLICKFIKICPASILHKIFIKGKYDLEIAFLEGYSTKIISGAKKVRKLAWVHVDPINNPWSTQAFINYKSEKEAYKSFDKILCVSNTVKNAFEEKYKLRSQVQFNVINNKEIISRSMEIINDMQFSNDFNVITVGRLTEQKAYLRLLRVHFRLLNEGFKYTLYILGEGEQRDALEQYINNNNITDSVKLLGFKSNPYKYMKNADLFVCSSISEGYSTVATESIILGLPVVTTNCAGMDDLLGNSEYGLITENSEEGLYQGLKKMLKDRTLYENYKMKAIERGQYFNLEKRITELEKILDECNN